MAEYKLSDLMTVRDAAKELDVTPQSIYNWFAFKKLTKVEFGNHTYTLKEEVRLLKEERRQKGE